MKPPCESCDSWRPETQQIKDGVDIGVEAVVPLAGKGDVAFSFPIEFENGLLRIAIELIKRRNAIFGGLVAIVALIVKGRGDALIVRRNDSRAQNGLGMPSDLGDGIHLKQVLIRVESADVVGSRPGTNPEWCSGS